jgi:membrane protein
MKDYFTKKIFCESIEIIKQTSINFINDRGLKLSASLSYYTVFSLAPLLLLLISLAGFFYGREAIQGHVFHEINGLIGNQAALQVQETIKNMEFSGKTNTALVVGIITLIVGATGVFSEIQDSINIIWKLKVKPKRGWVKIIKDRLLSFSLIVGLGFLLIVSLIMNGVLLALNNFLKIYFPDVTLILFQILNIVISFGVITMLFAIIFKVLPDAKIDWKDVRIGAFFTACLFMIGRFVIGLYIESSSTGTVYGAAGSIIIILVWVYYTAAILYFGAEFTKVYIEHVGSKIYPAQYAVFVEELELELK